MELLPVEVLHRMLHQLPPKEMKVAVLVSRRWREAGERPCLWSWVSLPLVCPGNLAEVLEVMKSPRMQRTKRLVTEGLAGKQALLLVEEVARHQGLQELVLTYGPNGPVCHHRRLCMEGCPALGLVPPALLAQAVTKLVRVDLADALLSLQQVTALCAALGQGCSLRSLGLGWTDVSGVEAVLLARAVAALEETSLENVLLTPRQATFLCIALSEDNRLTKINLSQNDLSVVPTRLLVQAVTRVEQVNLRGARLTGEQVTAIFAALASGPCRLAALDMSFIDLKGPERSEGSRGLRHVPAELLAKGINRLESATLTCADLEGYQVTAILGHSVDAIRHGVTRLRELIVGETCGVKGSLVTAARTVIPRLEIDNELTEEEEMLNIFGNGVMDSDGDFYSFKHGDYF